MNELCTGILKKINSGIIILSEQFIILYWSEWLERYTGIQQRTVLGKRIEEVIPVFQKNHYQQLFQQSLIMGQCMFCSGGLHPVFIYPLNAAKDSVVKQNLQIDVINFEGKKCLFLQIFDTTNQFKRVETLKNEISNRKEMEQLLFREKEQFKTTLLSVGDGVISTDRLGMIQIVNKVAERLTGWSQGEAAGRLLEDVFKIVDEETGEKYEILCGDDFFEDCVKETIYQALLIARDDTALPIETSVSPIRSEDGTVNGMVWVFRDITEKKQRQDEIRFLSFHDQLTGLYNRRSYEMELRRLDDGKNLPLTLVLGDINELKLINDTFGHAIGDELIVKTAEAMKKSARSEDLLFRIGGDEFVMLMPKTDHEGAEKIIRQIMAAAANEKVETLDISISFGFETKTDDAEKISDVFKSAEDQMYHNKLFESSYMRGKTVNKIIKTLYEKINREEQHSHGVSALCQGMGSMLGLKEHEIRELKTAGLLHDIGKIAIDEAILNKPGRLTPEERIDIQRHSEIGYRILGAVNERSGMAEHVLSHHEWWDGSGYPKGLKGIEIPLKARIISIADAFDAMTSERCYSTSMSAEEAFAELRKNAGIQFDPGLVEPFIQWLLQKNGLN